MRGIETSSVIVDDLNVLWPARAPTEADAPLNPGVTHQGKRHPERPGIGLRGLIASQLTSKLALE
jgi:hypothetical protein